MQKLSSSGSFHSLYVFYYEFLFSYCHLEQLLTLLMVSFLTSKRNCRAFKFKSFIFYCSQIINLQNVGMSKYPIRIINGPLGKHEIFRLKSFGYNLTSTRIIKRNVSIRNESEPQGKVQPTTPVYHKK